jgi:mRNA interferase MazF
MATFTVGAVVLVPFPFSDLSQSKLRPAVVLAAVARDDFILCQVTSKAYGDDLAIAIDNNDFAVGSLKVMSYARPSKLFTGNGGLIVRQVGLLKPNKLKEILDAVIDLFQVRN